MSARKHVFAIVALVLILSVVMGGTVGAQTFWQRFDNVLVKSMESTGNVQVDGTLGVTGASTLGAATISTLNATGNSSVAGTFAANGTSLSIAKTLNLTRQTAIAVTEGAVITPTGTFQELTAAGGVTATLADPAAAGQTLILFNSTSNAITIADGSGRYFAGNLVLAAYDNATLISTAQGSWMEIGRSDN